VSEKTSIVRTGCGREGGMVVRGQGANNKGIVCKPFIVRTGKEVGGRGMRKRMRLRLSAGGGYGVYNGKGLISETLVVGTVSVVDAVFAEAER